jgi:hypothetical protein
MGAGNTVPAVLRNDTQAKGKHMELRQTPAELQQTPNEPAMSADQAIQALFDDAVRCAALGIATDEQWRTVDEFGLHGAVEQLQDARKKGN